MVFARAKKEQCKLRMAIFAPSGGGKTYTSLLFGSEMGEKIAYIDTENRSSTKYVGEEGIPEFDIADMTYNGQDRGAYIDRLVMLINQASKEYDVVIVDSLTHAWTACKDEVDAAAKRMKTQNTYAAWRDGSTYWLKLINAILNCKSHIIICARSKMEYVQEKGQDNKTKIVKVGLAPELRDGMEYEFDIVCELDIDHTLVVTKSRCFTVSDIVATKPTSAFMLPIKAWLSSGQAKKEPDLATIEKIMKVDTLLKATGTSKDNMLKFFGIDNLDVVEVSIANQMIDMLSKRLEKMSGSLLIGEGDK